MSDAERRLRKRLEREARDNRLYETRLSRLRDDRPYPSRNNDWGTRNGRKPYNSRREAPWWDMTKPSYEELERRYAITKVALEALLAFIVFDLKVVPPDEWQESGKDDPKPGPPQAPDYGREGRNG